MNGRPTHLLHVFPTFAVGGAQMRFAQLAKAYGRRYRHTVIALDSRTDMASRIGGDVAIDYRELQFDKSKVWTNHRLFRRVIDEISPDTLVTYNWGAVEWALANRFGLRRRHVHIEDGFGPEEAHRQLQRRVWMRRVALSGRHSTVVLPSQGLERLALDIWRLPRQRIRHIPNGIDCAKFSVDIQSRRSRPAPLVIGTLATLRKEKNVGRLIAAFCTLASNLPETPLQLLIVGDGPDAATLQALAQRSSFADQILFAGPTREPEIWYPKMDIFALSSDTEQMPFSVLEAMAAGLPVVSTSVGDIASLVAPDNGRLIVPVRDETAYQAALAELVRDVSLRLNLGHANQIKARAEFDEQLMAERYAEVFG